MKIISDKTMLLILVIIMLFGMVACSGFNDSSSDSSAMHSSSKPSESEGNNMTTFNSTSYEFSEPGIVAETDDFIFLTDYYNVYRVMKQTGETLKIFSSDILILCVMEYCGQVFIQHNDGTVYITDYNGSTVRPLTNTRIIFISEGYLYYEYDRQIKRRTISESGNEELILDWLKETNGLNDIGFWTYYIGYYDKKVYFQQDKKIYSFAKDATIAYCCDGEFISLDTSKLIILRGNTLYSKDLVTGKEQQIGYNTYSTDIHVFAEYIGEYAGKEYYNIEGKIFTDANELKDDGNVTFDSVETAIVVSEWIYMDCLSEDIQFLRYNIETKQKEPISELGRSTTFYKYKNHLYYIDSSEIGLFQIDLMDNSCKQIYNGKMYVFENLI